MNHAPIRLIDPSDAEPSRVELEFVAGLNALRLRRQSIYWDWRPASVPFVTLKQATWLLLGQDPLQVERALPSYRVLRRRRFRELTNRLECSVAANELRPIGKHVEGFPRRFRLADIATLAVRRNVAAEHAKEILAINAETPTVRAHYEKIELDKRLEVHRQFVEGLGAAAIPVSAKEKKLSRRKLGVSGVDRQLALSRQDYDQAFRNFRDSRFPDQAGDPASAKMLDDDRRQLNIQLKKGRPRANVRP